jgi:DNA-binding transcriptional LysR family regulator
VRVDSVTLTELRVLAAVAREGSFSGAARRLGRVQSAVSHAMNSLEASLGVTLWDRSRRVPVLTAEGRSILSRVESILDGVDALESLAEALGGGVEAEVGLVVDAFYPLEPLALLASELKQTFPRTRLRLAVESQAAVCEAVLSGDAALGVAAGAAAHAGLVSRRLSEVTLVPAVARTHPLAAEPGTISTERLQQEVQLVLSERGASRTPDRGILSGCDWRVADLQAKRELIRAGVGWGNLPDGMVAADPGLVAIRVAAWSPEQHRLPLELITRRGATHGPAASWVSERIVALVSASGPRVRSARRARRA